MDKIQELNEMHAVVQYGGETLILNEEKADNGLKQITFSSTSSFEKRYCNQTVQMGNRTEKLGKFWLEHADRRQYGGVVFDPNCARPNRYNLWQGFPIKPIESDCGLYLSHIYNVIAGGNQGLGDYILDYMADAVQNPGKKPGVALVLRGEQGVGKGIFVKYFGKLFEPHFVEITNSNHFLGNFNSILDSKLLVFIDEAFWAGDKKAEGILKALVTEDYNNIERKGKDVIRQRNFVRLIVASNNDWVIPAMSSERRFCVLDVSNVHRQDHAYFEKIVDQMDNGGLEGLMYHLQNRDVTSANVRKFPQTTALMEQKIHSMSPFESWWYDCLMRGYILAPNAFDSTNQANRNWTNSVPVAAAFQSMIASSKDRGIQNRLGETQFGKEMKKVLPQLKKSRIKFYDDETPVVSGTVKRENVYELPPLEECREHFNKEMNFSIDWPDP
jgi:hypothetical protein